MARILWETPRNKDIALVVPYTDGNSSALVQTIGSLIWPRRLFVTELSGTNDFQQVVNSVASSRPGLVLFHRLRVPFKGGTALGPNLVYFRAP